jgi:hypothetical protein
MKTPREILLARHQAVTPKLDALREQVVHTAGKSSVRFGWLAGWAMLLRGLELGWREVIFPSRRIWAGLAAVWVGLLVFNLSERAPKLAVASRQPSSSAMLMTWRDQKNMLNEVFAEPAPLPVADRPRTFTPRPRTEASVPLVG